MKANFLFARLRYLHTCKMFNVFVMNPVSIKDTTLREAAAKGVDEFVNAFYDSIMEFSEGQLTEESMRNLNADQITLVVFKTIHDEVMDGGFVQLIYNGYGPFVFFNPFAKAVRIWGLDDLAALVNKAGKLFRRYGREIERECTDEEFMAMFEKYPEFDDLDDKFVENEEHWINEIAHYIDGHIDKFASIVE